MKKIRKILCTCVVLALLVWLGSVVADRENLSSNLIRLHVVANSDDPADQQIKLQVKDLIAGNLQTLLKDKKTAAEAKAYLQEHLDDLEELANRALQDAGSDCRATVTLSKEAFPQREYDTFSLPAGVYESLKISIGEGEGKNWWCVVFPSLCIPSGGEDFEDAAAGAGFPDSLSGALSKNEGYEVRFFLLDCLGWVQNLFFK